jgi:hypothetical protein
MTWSFLAPLYFAGAIGLAIPIIIHLHNRKPTHVYAFPTLRFLIKSTVSSHKWRNILRWIVLLLRLLAFAALISAFAQPWKHIAVPPSGKLAILILDTSCSVQAGSTWSELQSAATDWINREGKDSRIAIISMARSSRVIHSFNDSVETQLAGIRSLKPTFEGTNPDAAIRLADQLLRSAPAKSKKIHVLSDLAANSWQTVQWNVPLSPGIGLETLPPPSTVTENAGVTELGYPISFWETNTTIQVGATIRNFSTTSEETRTVTLSIANEPDQTQKISVQAFSSQEVIFSVTPREFKNFNGKIQITPGDTFAPDDTRFFAIKPMKTTRVARIAAMKNQDTDLFLRTALMPRDSSNRYTWVDLPAQPDRELKAMVDIIVLDQGEPLNDVMGEAIRKFVKDGGSILMFCGEADRLAPWKKTGSPLNWGKENIPARSLLPSILFKSSPPIPFCAPSFFPREAIFFGWG